LKSKEKTQITTLSPQLPKSIYVQNTLKQFLKNCQNTIWCVSAVDLYKIKRLKMKGK